MRALVKPLPATAVAVAMIAAVALAACDGGDSGSGNPQSERIDFKQALAGAPAPLAKLYANGDALVPGGLDELNSKLASVRGYPAVVNVWASWCGPCRFEFPDLQKVASERGKKVAFIGVDTDDSDDAAATFLDELPLPYPSITDPDKQVFDEYNLRGLPATAFYDSAGELQYVKQGPYTSEEQLRADIDKYSS